MSINTSPPPRFHIPASHTSSITIPLSPCIPPHPSFPGRCRNSNNRDFGGSPNYTNNNPKKLQSLGDFENHHHNNEHNNYNDNTVSTTHTQEKSIFSPHSNRSGILCILCHNFVFEVLQFCILYAIIPMKKRRSSHQRYYIKKVFLKISQNSQEKTWILRHF